MDSKKLLIKLGFSPKENTSDIFIKKYTDGYSIEVDFVKSCINYGNKIKYENKTTSNFSQPENWVVLECVDRLLQKGYNPENIILEKTWQAGHGTSGRLDICVTHDDSSEYLLIECKTYGKEFDKAVDRLNKDGGQLFTYFKFSNKADIIMLYASELKGKEIVYRNEIVKIEDDYRTGDKDDFYRKWNKQAYTVGVWENTPYNFSLKAFTKADLKELTEEEGRKLFNGFASILRKHSVSDKPNAFNKIFNLFLAKLYDEAKRDNDELEFHWRNNDDPVDFQVRLHNLHKAGLYAFLKKEIEGIKDEDFQVKGLEELKKAKKKLLKFNKLFDIKDVLDDESFDANHRVLKDVVKLLEKYRIRYPRKQQHLSDFFEHLLTTGLKQEAGQYFTPPPITKFIIKSLPLSEMIKREINKEEPKLPAVIDYAAGSGHFVTEILEEYQNVIDSLDTSNYFPKAKQKVKSWSKDGDPYSWAAKYIYGIEKDYRLVKVAKVGCYFYGDGVAQIIHADGLDSLTTPPKSYVGLLSENSNTEDASKNKFSLILSNPPYSVDDCRDDLEYIGSEKEFTLYKYLTEKSKEIECLFVERTKQLLKDGGIAGVILPSSILSNTGIYTKTREIIFKYFEIIAITELGSNTFMATGTNTVALFLRRRNNYDYQKIENSLENSLNIFQDNTINGVEKPIGKYLAQVWESVSFNDYVTLLKKQPNEAIKTHEIYGEYDKKIKARNEAEKLRLMVEKETEKLLYFILAFPQQIVLVKSGEKDAEKRFLGYEFSNRRGSEGIHPIQRGKAIDECTQLFDAEIFDNPQKASTYIYKAFGNDFDFPIDPSLQKNVFRMNLVDMMTFDRVDFEKNISLAVKKKVKIESKWDVVRISDICEVGRGQVINKKEIEENFGTYPVYSSQTSNDGIFGFLKTFDFEGEYVTWTTDGIYAGSVFYRKGKFNCTNVCGTLKSKSERVHMPFLAVCLPLYTNDYVVKVANPKLMNNVMASIQIPLPPKEIQEKIVSEIEVLEEKERKGKEGLEVLKENISKIFSSVNEPNQEKLDNINILLKRGKSAKYGNSNIQIIKSGQARGYKNFDFSERHFVDAGFVLDERQLQKGDILINSSGVGTAGRVTLFNLEGIFVVDSHISILRLDQSKALPNFVLYSLSNIGFKNIEAMALGQSGQIELSLTTIQNIKIPLPSLSDQQKIVSEIEAIEKQITALEQELATIPQEKEMILKKYL